MTEHTINENFCYNTTKDLSLSNTHKALRRYLDNKQEALNISGKIPIVVDTSVLLTYYGMSQQDRKKLLDFFIAQQDRIILTNQVEKEFLRNRLNVIQTSFFNHFSQIHQSFENTYAEIKNTFNKFINDYKKLFTRDYPEIWQKLHEKQQLLEQTILGDEKELGGQIKKQIEETTRNHQNIYIDDQLLNVCSQFTVLPQLSEEEIAFIERLYADLYKKYQDTERNEKQKFVFPGCGDQGKKSYPYGDFIIFHEILKLMKTGSRRHSRGQISFYLLMRKLKKIGLIKV